MWIFRLEGRLGNYDGDGNENAKNRSEKSSFSVFMISE